MYCHTRSSIKTPVLHFYESLVCLLSCFGSVHTLAEAPIFWPPDGKSQLIRKDPGDFPGGSVVKNLPASAGDTGSILRSGRSHMPQSN